MALLEAQWAKHHVHLAPEPPGERSGLAAPQAVRVGGPDGFGSEGGTDQTDSNATPITMVATGDSMVAGCGVSDQREGLIPDLAFGVAQASDRPVSWNAYGKLGATMRRVRYRFLPQIEGQSDLLVLCAGSNDVMARRSIEEWREDLLASVRLAKQHTSHLIVLSSGQVHRCPALGRTLRNSIASLIDEQTKVSRGICEQEGASFVDLTHAYTITAETGFWGPDRFHPSKYGYQRIADLALDEMAPVIAKL